MLLLLGTIKDEITFLFFNFIRNHLLALNHENHQLLGGKDTYIEVVSKNLKKPTN